MKTMLLILISSFIYANAYGMGHGIGEGIDQPEAGDLPTFQEVVKDKIYRGGQPTEAGIRILAEKKMKTVINLRSEDEDQRHRESRWVRKAGMTFISVPLNGLFEPSHKDMEFIERTLEDSEKYPIFIHCYYGKDRTGLAIGLYRVFAEKVEPKAAYEEMILLGFRPILFGLRKYFFNATGYDNDDLRMEPSLLE